MALGNSLLRVSAGPASTFPGVRPPVLVGTSTVRGPAARAAPRTGLGPETLPAPGVGRGATLLAAKAFLGFLPSASPMATMYETPRAAAVTATSVIMPTRMRTLLHHCIRKAGMRYDTSASQARHLPFFIRSPLPHAGHFMIRSLPPHGAMQPRCSDMGYPRLLQCQPPRPLPAIPGFRRLPCHPVSYWRTPSPAARTLLHACDCPPVHRV